MRCINLHFTYLLRPTVLHMQMGEPRWRSHETPLSLDEPLCAGGGMHSHHLPLDPPLIRM